MPPPPPSPLQRRQRCSGAALSGSTSEVAQLPSCAYACSVCRCSWGRPPACSPAAACDGELQRRRLAPAAAALTGEFVVVAIHASGEVVLLRHCVPALQAAQPGAAGPKSRCWGRAAAGERSERVSTVSIKAVRGAAFLAAARRDRQRGMPAPHLTCRTHGKVSTRLQIPQPGSPMGSLPTPYQLNPELNFHLCGQLCAQRWTSASALAGPPRTSAATRTRPSPSCLCQYGSGGSEWQC